MQLHFLGHHPKCHLDVHGMYRGYQIWLRCIWYVQGIAGTWRKDSNVALVWEGSGKTPECRCSLENEQNSSSGRWYIPGRRKNLWKSTMSEMLEHIVTVGIKLENYKNVYFIVRGMFESHSAFRQECDMMNGYSRKLWRRCGKRVGRSQHWRWRISTRGIGINPIGGEVRV